VFTDCHQGNSQLVDIAYVLDIQQLAPAGTLVANNSQLCFDAALSWSHRSDSHLEYRIDQVCHFAGCCRRLWIANSFSEP
jgi:hypothetical protein